MALFPGIMCHARCARRFVRGDGHNSALYGVRRVAVAGNIAESASDAQRWPSAFGKAQGQTGASLLRSFVGAQKNVRGRTCTEDGSAAEAAPCIPGAGYIGRASRSDSGCCGGLARALAHSGCRRRPDSACTAYVCAWCVVVMYSMFTS